MRLRRPLLFRFLRIWVCHRAHCGEGPVLAMLATLRVVRSSPPSLCAVAEYRWVGAEKRREDRTGKWFLASQTEKNGALNEAWRYALCLLRKTAIDATACGNVERVSATAVLLRPGSARRSAPRSPRADPLPCPAEPEQGLGPHPSRSLCSGTAVSKSLTVPSPR